MNPLVYLKSVIAVVGANTIPPIAEWLVGLIPAPDNVHQAMAIILTAIIIGPAVYIAPNVPKKTP